MDTDFPIDLITTTDDVQFARGGGVVRYRKYVFYLGKHGPFTERVPVEPTFDENELGRRVLALRTHLRTLQTL
jgi:hypothetical protein